jgi:S-methylmethionine-dependent homocysteine/selenocysteine methylase
MVDRTAPLPQLSGRVFLTDAGLETDLIFHHGVEIREFAAHTLLPIPADREKMAEYFRGYLRLAQTLGTGYILDAPTWKIHPHWATALGEDEAAQRRANHEAIAFIAGLRDEFPDAEGPVLLNAVIGPRGDAYAPDATISAEQAEAYHATQLGWLAETEVDMVTALTHTQGDEAAGFSRAAKAARLPHVISFTVEINGRLPTGPFLGRVHRCAMDPPHPRPALQRQPQEPRRTRRLGDPRRRQSGRAREAVCRYKGADALAQRLRRVLRLRSSPRDRDRPPRRHLTVEDC